MNSQNNNALKGKRKLNWIPKHQRGKNYYNSTQKERDDIKQNKIYNSNEMKEEKKQNPLNHININIHQQLMQEGEADVIEDDLLSTLSIQTAVYQNNRYKQYNHRYNNNFNSNTLKSITWRDKTYSWRKFPDSNDLIKKMAEIEKYGVRDIFTQRSVFKRYGIKILEKDYCGRFIALYEGNINDFIAWCHAYLHTNFKYHLDVFSRLDLFGTSKVCGIDLQRNAKYGYEVIWRLCYFGWSDGLKYIMEKLKINHINDSLELLATVSQNLHDDILKYLLLQNDLYQPFDIKTRNIKTRKGWGKNMNTTLWTKARSSLISAIKSGKGWLHCLENIHYADDIIRAVHGWEDSDEEKQEKQQEQDMAYLNEGNQFNQNQMNEMMQQLNHIQLERNKIRLSPLCIKSRLDLINAIINKTKSVVFKIESCYYGLCVASALYHRSLQKLIFWAPRAVKDLIDGHIFEHVPYKNTEWGLLGMHKVSKKHYLTVLKMKQKVELKKLLVSNHTIDDTQLWKIQQLNILGGIWVKFINKAGYKLIISWRKDFDCNHMPLLQISDEVDKDDRLCRDVFSVTNNNRDTLYGQYCRKYKHIKNNTTPYNRETIGTKMSTYQFWNLPEEKNKFQCYKLRLQNIAQIIEQYSNRHINQ